MLTSSLLFTSHPSAQIYLIAKRSISALLYHTHLAIHTTAAVLQSLRHWGPLGLQHGVCECQFCCAQEAAGVCGNVRQDITRGGGGGCHKVGGLLHHVKRFDVCIVSASLLGAGFQRLHQGTSTQMHELIGVSFKKSEGVRLDWLLKSQSLHITFCARSSLVERGGARGGGGGGGARRHTVGR